MNDAGDVFRSGGRSTRRRRLLNDSRLRIDLGHDEAEPTATRARRRRARPEPPPLMEQLPSIAALYPQRNTTVALLSLLWVVGVLLLVGLHRLASDMPLRALDLLGHGSLATWLTAFALALAATAALGTYAIGKRRLGDYRAQYRVWLAVSVVWLVLSIDAVAGLHEAVEWLVATYVGLPLLAQGSVGWLLAALCGFVPLGLMLWPRMTPTARSSLVVGFVLWLVAASLPFQPWVAKSAEPLLLLGVALRMLASGSVLLAMLLQARRVIQEVLPQEAPPSTASEPRDEPAPTPVRSRPTARTATAAKKAAPAGRSTVEPSEPEPDDDEEEEDDEDSEIDDVAPSPPPPSRSRPPAPQPAQETEWDDADDEPVRQESAAQRRRKGKRRRK